MYMYKYWVISHEAGNWLKHVAPPGVRLSMLPPEGATQFTLMCVKLGGILAKSHSILQEFSNNVGPGNTWAEHAPECCVSHDVNKTRCYFCQREKTSTMR